MKRVQDKRYAASIKPLAVLTLSLILTLIMCLPAFAAVSKAQAMKTAKKMVPASCRCTEAEHEKDDREWRRYNRQGHGTGDGEGEQRMRLLIQDLSSQSE